MLSCVEMLCSKVGLNFHSQYFYIAIKGGFYDDVAGCSASMYCLHEHSPPHSHISPGEELLWEVFFVLFLTGGYRLPQKNLQIHCARNCEHSAEVSCNCLSGALV